MKTLVLVLMAVTFSAFADGQTGIVKITQATATNRIATVYSAKVKAKSATTITVILVGQPGVAGIGGIGHSIINSGNGKPHDARKTSKDAVRDKEAAEALATRTLVGHPDPTRVMIGSTITFKATGDGSTLTWVE